MKRIIDLVSHYLTLVDSINPLDRNSGYNSMQSSVSSNTHLIVIRVSASIACAYRVISIDSEMRESHTSVLKNAKEMSRSWRYELLAASLKQNAENRNYV